jgi:hypothetical protein
MTTKLRKAAISTIAVTLGAGVTATATPSAAQGWHGHGWHGHGWHGGGLARRLLARRTLVRRRLGRAPVAAGVLGGLALGALAGSAYAYDPAYYGGCNWQNQPAYDGWGNFVGYQPVQVCY